MRGPAGRPEPDTQSPYGRTLAPAQGLHGSFVFPSVASRPKTTTRPSAAHYPELRFLR
jgi:hypothetical protein